MPAEGGWTGKRQGAAGAAPARRAEGATTMNEADTCRKLVRPRLEAAGWDTLPHSYSE
jgi:hypothetical protein